MLKDYEVLYNAELLLSKRLIIWGAGLKGRELAEKLSRYNIKIEFVDSDEKRQDTCHGIPVCSPERIKQYSKENLAIIISPEAPMVQEGILTQISKMGCQDIDIYTKFTVDRVICFLKNNGLKMDEAKLGSGEICAERDNDIKGNLDARYKLMKQIFMADMSEKSVYIYQPKKVGSVSLVYSAKAVGVYGVHVHSFSWCFGGEERFVRDIVKKTSGKVITLVREPVARQISLMWHYWAAKGDKFLQNVHSMEELERKFYLPNNEDEFEWYNNEFQKVLGINIYDYPFDRDLGYTIIEENGIQVLLLKLEKMNSLKKVIGDFLEVPEFELINRNAAQYKDYRYAYQNYLENVKIPLELWEHHYNGNKYMDYFYTEDEKKQFYKRWELHIMDS